jgi:rod shape-determining protein MreB
VAEVVLIPSVLAGAVGAGIEVARPEGSMLFLGGGSSCEVAVFSLGEVVSLKSRPGAGVELYERVARYFSQQCGLVIAMETAAEIVTSLIDLSSERRHRRADVWGRDGRSGEVRQARVDEDELVQVALPVVSAMLNLVPEVLASCQAEIVADVAERGVHLAGGLAGIVGFRERLASVAQVMVTVPDEADLVVLRGLAEIMRQPNRSSYSEMVELQGKS